MQASCETGCVPSSKLRPVTAAQLLIPDTRTALSNHYKYSLHDQRMVLALLHHACDHQYTSDEPAVLSTSPPPGPR